MLLVAPGRPREARAWVAGWGGGGDDGNQGALAEGLSPRLFEGEYGLGRGKKTSDSLSPQLCCLHADMLGSLGPKEARKAFLDFCHSFLEKTAVRNTFGGPQPLPAPFLGPGETLGHPGPPSAAPSPQTVIPSGLLGCGPVTPPLPSPLLHSVLCSLSRAGFAGASPSHCRL